MDKNYEEKPANCKIVNLFEEYLEEFNMSSPSKMKLVFFEDAIAHVARIARILRQPRGHAMLVGVGGSGKQSLTKLACSMCEYKLMQVELSRGYGHQDFLEFIKSMMLMAGVEGKSLVFLFTENAIIMESFVEDINNLLNSGEIPNLWPNDEMQKILEDMNPVVQKLGLPATRSVVYQTFVNRVRENLHVVICMSPVGSAFRVRCRQFPSLINCCTIDWYVPLTQITAQHHTAPADAPR
jgi:dynein heavy chain